MTGTSKSYLLRHRLHLFNMVITLTLTYASGTWTLSNEHKKMIRSTQRKMLRLIIQKKRKYIKKVENSNDERKTINDEEPTSDEKAEEKDVAANTLKEQSNRRR